MVQWIGKGMEMKGIDSYKEKEGTEGDKKRQSPTLSMDILHQLGLNFWYLKNWEIQ